MNTTVKHKTQQPLSASTMIGTKVRNTQGENLGDIKELMLDPQTGHTRYAVIDFGGFLGIGNKLFAVPFEAFRVDRDEEAFVLEVTRETLKNAEGFDQNDWPDFSNQKVEQHIYDTYSVTPYWNR